MFVQSERLPNDVSGHSALELAVQLSEGDWCPTGRLAKLAQLVTAGWSGSRSVLSTKSRVRSLPLNPRAGVEPGLGGG